MKRRRPSVSPRGPCISGDLDQCSWTILHTSPLFARTAVTLDLRSKSLSLMVPRYLMVKAARAASPRM
ncbi:MAG: hypothetical protein QXD04_04795, partial [Candidatus Bathyarchaeia archaeon]